MEREGRTYSLTSPVVYIRRQKKILDKFLKNKPVSYVIAFDDDTDLSGVSCSYDAVHVSDIVQYLMDRKATEVSETEMLDAFEAFKTHTHDEQ